MSQYIARETDQNPGRIAELVEMIEAGLDADIAPIVTIDGTLIIDGHHRTIAFAQCGQIAPSLSITQAQYDAAIDAGFDDLDIAAAAHLLLSDGRGLDLLAAQFPGVDMYAQAEAVGRVWEA